MNIEESKQLRTEIDYLIKERDNAIKVMDFQIQNKINYLRTNGIIFDYYTKMKAEKILKKYISESLAIPHSCFTSSIRKKPYVLARAVYAYSMYKFTDITLVEIGNQLGNRDHATVIHSIKKIEDMLQYRYFEHNKIGAELVEASENKLKLFKKNETF